MFVNDNSWLESILGECNHSQETKHGTLGAVNPISGKCCICGKQVLKEVADVRGD